MLPAPTLAAPDPPAAAIAHYNRARELYQEGKYRDAVSELELALKLDPSSPNLVYNVARVYELLGEIERAITYYTKYRDMLPRSEREERERVGSVLQRLKGARTQLDGPHDGPVVNPRREPQQPQPELKRGVADRAFWTTAASAVVVLGAGGAMGWLALDEEREALDFELNAAEEVNDRDSRARRADRLALAADVTLILGGTLALTSVLLYALRKQPREQGPEALRLSLQAGPTGGLITVGGRL